MGTQRAVSLIPPSEKGVLFSCESKQNSTIHKKHMNDRWLLIVFFLWGMGFFLFLSFSNDHLIVKKPLGPLRPKGFSFSGGHMEIKPRICIP